MTRELEGLVALVTGAGNDVGQATALAFAREGARVVVSDLDGRGAEQLVTQIRQAGGEAQFIAADVCEESDVVDLIAGTLEAHGRLDVAFNNVAISGTRGAIGELSEMQWSEIVAVNLTGVLLSMKHELAQMEQQGKGSIVNNASLLSTAGLVGAAAYLASKQGALGLTKVAALNYASKGIRVNAVSGLGAPAEVAEAVIFLASPQASFVTGHPLLVDGGFVSM